MFFPISRLPSPLLVLPYPKLPSGWAAVGCYSQAPVWVACFVLAQLHALVCAHTCARTHAHASSKPHQWSACTTQAQRVHVLRGSAQLCEHTLTQVVGSLLSKTGTLVRDGFGALYACWEGEIRDRRSLPGREILGLVLGMGSTWFSVHA